MKRIGNLVYNEDKIAKLCEENDISYLALFGSYLHGDNNKKSDIDLLVNFKKPLGLMKFSKVRNEISDAFNKRVDLVMTDALHQGFKDDVIKDSVTLFQDA
jgi:hypothetical protein